MIATSSLLPIYSDDVSYSGPALRTILRPPGEKTRSTSINLDFLVQREVCTNVIFSALNLL